MIVRFPDLTRIVRPIIKRTQRADQSDKAWPLVTLDRGAKPERNLFDLLVWDPGSHSLGPVLCTGGTPQPHKRSVI